MLLLYKTHINRIRLAPQYLLINPGGHDAIKNIFEFCKSSINYKDEIHFVIMCPLYNKICEKILLENTIRLQNLSKNVQDYAELFRLEYCLQN